jgi:hypothetical protein
VENGERLHRLSKGLTEDDPQAVKEPLVAFVGRQPGGKPVGLNLVEDLYGYRDGSTEGEDVERSRRDERLLPLVACPAAP